MASADGWRGTMIQTPFRLAGYSVQYVKSGPHLLRLLTGDLGSWDALLVDPPIPDWRREDAQSSLRMHAPPIVLVRDDLAPGQRQFELPKRFAKRNLLHAPLDPVALEEVVARAILSRGGSGYLLPLAVAEADPERMISHSPVFPGRE